VVLRPDGDKTEQPFEGDEPDLEVLQSLVGGWIELVPVAWAGKRRNAFVNEEGRLHKMPINPEASRAFGRVIVGTMVIVIESRA
jgi:hypothetical protein